MPSRTKRTYSLRPETVLRVRELAARYGTSQDAMVDTAVERLDRSQRADDEARAWESSAEDAEFLAEAREISATFDKPDRWPA